MTNDMNPTPLTTLDAVRTFARDAHAGQTDKLGRDYYTAHLLPIAARMEQHGEHAEMAGLLHDVLEDTPVTADELRARYLPEEVIRAIESVSWSDDIAGTYDDLIERAAADPLGRLVKLADNAINLESNSLLAAEHPETAARLRAKYEKARARLSQPIN